MSEVMTAQDLEILEQQTNYHAFLKNKTKCCGDDMTDGICDNCGEKAELCKMACWRPE